MIKKENKYQIAQEKQREKYKKSLDSFNAYVQKNQKNHTEKIWIFCHIFVLKHQDLY